MATEKTQKNAKKYICEKCDYNTSNKTDYMRHINTIKHKNNVFATNGNKWQQKNAKKYICECCEKEYNDRSGLWKHSKNCNIANKNIECAPQNELPKKETIDKDYLLIELLKQNKELLEIITPLRI